ncbi:LiaI-LiaF-like domain-containing protein [Roseateles sp. DB2]|uniref:LiaI-LiaF-like domain-containing protein n=1 Tax=Roseateles sp. DB2 TaxID=3453717 RepID=UPI003EEC841E
MNTSNTRSTPGRAARHQLWLGLTLVLAGGAFLLDNLHVLELRRILPFWPVLMVALGAARLLTAAPGDRREQLIGGLLLGLGSLLLLRRLGWLHMDWRDFWPLVLIGLGVMVMARQPGQGGPFGHVNQDVHDRQLDLKAVLSGQEVRVQSSDFTGGQVQAVLAGVELDLSQAGFQRAVLEVSVVMAGLELRLPPDCRLRVTASSVLGQVEDKTQPLAAASRELELRGSLVLGGITVRH